ncbi:MAG: PQQ-binding-like beta-propeller repeat protein [Proteobacteria bacterium]|nr:PQQ-binding-like beta-propeller repeat protein [Pseudomonadota bacterium]
MRRDRALASVGLALLLGACDLLPDWLGEPEEPPLPGERVSVLSLQRTPEPDPSIAKLEVRLPKPWLNPEWPQTGGYASHAMHHLAAPGPLARAWTVDIGEGGSDDRSLLANPVVGGGLVFTFDSAARVSVFDAETGKSYWRVATLPEADEDEAFGGGVAYERGRLYVATGAGEVIGLDARTGAELWRIAVGVPIRAAPTVSEGRVFVVSYDNQLFALNAGNGSLLWTHSGIAEGAQLLGAPSPAVAGGLVVAAYSSGELYALRAESGRVAWTETLAFGSPTGSLAALGDINGNPVIDRELVFAVSHAGRLVAVNLRDGERVWEQDISGVQTPWIAGDFLFVLTTDGDVLCLWRRDGRIRWVRPLPRYEDAEDREDPIFWSGPVLVSDRLIVVGSHGEAVSISPYSGRVLGRLDLGGETDLAPVVANGTMYILTNDAELVALR